MDGVAAREVVEFIERLAAEKWLVDAGAATTVALSPPVAALSLPAGGAEQQMEGRKLELRGIGDPAIDRKKVHVFTMPEEEEGENHRGWKQPPAPKKE